MMRPSSASADRGWGPWAAAGFYASLGVALSVLCWSALESMTSRQDLDFFLRVRGGALADALTHVIEHTLDADRAGAGHSAAAAAASHRELRVQLKRCCGVDYAGSRGLEPADLAALRGLDGVESLLHAVEGAGAIRFATLFDAAGHVLVTTGFSHPIGTPSVTLSRRMRGGVDRPGVMRIGIAAEPFLAAQRRAMQRNLVISLVAAALVCLMAALLLWRQRALLREARRDRSLMRAVLEGMGDGVLIVGAKGTLQLANPAACKLLGVQERDLIGKPRAETPCVELARQLSGANAALDTEIPRAGGAAIPVRATASPVRLAGEESSGTALILHDLTDAGRLERERRRNAALVAFGQIASSVAHEIRNPLNAIGMGVQRLEIEGLGRRNGSEPRRLLALIRSEVDRLDQILTRFLEQARPRRVEPARGDLDALLAELLPLIRESAVPDVSLSLERGGVTCAMFDADAMRQVILNLVRNAQEAVGERGRIEILTRREGAFGILEIRDDGPGIPNANRERVFEFGFTTKPYGSGLGLPVVHLLVSEMGGSVWIEPRAGGGTTIRIRLPLADGRRVEGGEPRS